MNLQEAKTLLDGCERLELRDHAFGDKEVTWKKDGIVIAIGYAGSAAASVTITVDPTASFGNDDARSLMSCGTPGSVGRNDETGPEQFVEGQTMPGLTLEGVRQELIDERVWLK